MDEPPPRLTVLPDEAESSGDRSSGRGPRWGVTLALAFGFAVGVVGIFLIVKVVRDGTAEKAADSPPAAVPTGAPQQLEILKIVFPEGFTRGEMAARITEVDQIAKEKRDVDPVLGRTDYLAATKSLNETHTSALPKDFLSDRNGPKSLEGFLFPATYEFTETTTSSELVGLQLKAFSEAWAKVNLSAAKKRNLTPYDVLIIASMVEKEVRQKKEQPLVAAVIYNRLRAGLPLGIDATIRYGLDIPAERAITERDLDDPTPYNTRIHTGLPPTPIANPGLAAIQAAAHPAKVKHLYFVRKKDCETHFFTASEEKFLAFLDGPNSFRNGPGKCP